LAAEKQKTTLRLLHFYRPAILLKNCSTKNAVFWLCTAENSKKRSISQTKVLVERTASDAFAGYRSAFAVFIFMEILELKDRFCEHAQFIKGMLPSTIRRYQTVLKLFVRRSGILRLEDATPEAVRKFFFEGRTRYGWGAQTFHSYHKTLSVFFKWCIREKLFASSPLADIEVPKIARTLKPKLTKEAALRLLEVARNYPYATHFHRVRNHAIFATFIYTGLRKQELLKLQFADVDIPNLTLFVRRGKGAKDRIVPMSQNLATILGAYVTEREWLGRTCAEFFVSHTHNVGMCDSSLRHLINDIRAASGVTFTAHKLRHTFATLMLEGGCDIYSLSRMLGHSDISTTTIYLAASAEHLRAQMTKHPLNGMAGLA